MSSRGVNRAIIIGNLGDHPKTVNLQNGGLVVNISVATSESWLDKTTSVKQERTEWHKIVAYGKLAEIMDKYLQKGSKVYIEGKLQTRKWQDKDGKDHYTTEIVANDMQMLDSRASGSETGNANQAAQQVTQSSPSSDFYNDKIPF